jgi:predicted histone-like DNA-binding protein
MKNKDGELLWFPRIVKYGQAVTTKDLAHAIAKRSSLSPGDVRSLVEDFMDIVKEHLLDGKSVFLDDFGSFTITCRASGTGVKTKEEVNPNQITQLKVRFTPTATRDPYQGVTRALFQGVSFKMIDGKEASKIEGDDDDDSNGGEYIDPNA